MATQAVMRVSERPLRRVPVQGRSVARVARMLDACADLLDEVGYDGLTTTQLAERAGVAIGSVYQFFPDKRAVVQALAVRGLEAYLARLVDRLAGVEFGHWWEAVVVAVDEYVAMHRTVPGFRALQFADVLDRHLLDDNRDNATVVADHLLRLLAGQVPGVGEPTVRRAFAIAVEVIDALIRTAFGEDPDGDPTVLDECKDLLREYLTRRVSTVATPATP